MGVVERVPRRRSRITKGLTDSICAVEMNSQKSKTKALEVGRNADGVGSVRLEGDHRDEMLVIGNGNDAVKLVKILRTKVGAAEIISVGGSLFE
ncbi:hypothetical protein FEM48_Zijuj01G0091300 [Ziziphus jujuba var. spinosa]|uniref:Heavy metal-associated isoprenylated plant protein 47-like n=1 Tax=Ziziphus jujuba var. spinosa TaxID=714518 RepID=A0A978W0D1_ZIZJJ|nr:hypothetical protein FEM48_Zijuj01G0091300 [Ziziphus jujuba var. spinosa]